LAGWKILDTPNNSLTIDLLKQEEEEEEEEEDYDFETLTPLNRLLDGYNRDGRIRSFIDLTS
jgi:hypothetical protein